jgi:hypothetical protein
MATVRCAKNQHVYDDAQYTHCPYCPVPGLPDMNIERTRAATRGSAGRPSAGYTEPDPRLRPSTASTPPGGGRSGGAARPGTPGVTYAAIKARTGIDPVVGWLVCVKGVNKGRDYRLHSDRNQIGRAPNMDVCVEGDETISRENHCQVIFSPRTKTYSLVPGTGRNLVYLNGDDVPAAMPLRPYDQIDLGEGSFVFLPFCNDDFDWERMAETGRSDTPAR